MLTEARYQSKLIFTQYLADALMAGQPDGPQTVVSVARLFDSGSAKRPFLSQHPLHGIVSSVTFGLERLAGGGLFR